MTSCLFTMHSYRTNMQRLSAVHRDQPVTPLSTAVFWVEFVMRHGGARHLRLASYDLNWFQYHSLDTGAALLIALMTVAALWWVGIRCILRQCRRRAGREKKDWREISCLHRPVGIYKGESSNKTMYERWETLSADPVQGTKHREENI